MVKTDPLTFLSSLRAWQLKHLAYLTGLNSSGTKAQLCKTLAHRMDKSAFPKPRCRILSIDMGVKNLAFCLLDLHKVPQLSEQGGTTKDDKSLSLHLSDWKRMDVSERLVAKHAVPTSVIPISGDSTNEAGESTDTSPEDQNNLYAPSSLSKIAYGLASEFLQYKPDYILIERQRFRSGGGPAIQEWTVRVNMLESMLWASLETMRNVHGKESKEQRQAFPEVLEMSPRRVGMFWLSREDLFPTAADIALALETPTEVVSSSGSEPKKKSFEKKDKIALARHWLSLSMTTDDLDVDAKLAWMVASFCAPRERKGRRRSRDDDEDEEDMEAIKTSEISGKLDDLADCLVQAVTFALWEQNRLRLKDYVGFQQ